jgi:hypothetical protein
LVNIFENLSKPNRSKRVLGHLGAKKGWWFYKS